MRQSRDLYVLYSVVNMKFAETLLPDLTAFLVCFLNVLMNLVHNYQYKPEGYYSLYLFQIFGRLFENGCQTQHVCLVCHLRYHW